MKRFTLLEWLVSNFARRTLPSVSGQFPPCKLPPSPMITVGIPKMNFPTIDEMTDPRLPEPKNTPAMPPVATFNEPKSAPAGDTCPYSPTKLHCRNANGLCAYCARDRDGNPEKVEAADLPRYPDTVEPKRKQIEVRVKATTAITLLAQAQRIQEQRAADYDQPEGERSMGATVDAFNIITRRTGNRALTESEGWLLMQILKDVRDRSTSKPHRDSLEDGIAYSSLKAEARLKE